MYMDQVCGQFVHFLLMFCLFWLITFLWFSCDTAAATLPYTVEWYEWEEGMWQCNNFYCFLASIHITRRSRPQCMHSHLAKPISTKTNKISHLASSDPHKHPESTIKQHIIGPMKCRHSNNTNGFTQIMQNNIPIKYQYLSLLNSCTVVLNRGSGGG